MSRPPKTVPDPSRRAFLMPGARPAAAEGGRLVAHWGERCLAVQGVECRVCGESCEAGAIRFPPRLGGAPLPQIDTLRCTGCADCLPRCPASALTLVAAPPAPG